MTTGRIRLTKTDLTLCLKINNLCQQFNKNLLLQKKKLLFLVSQSRSSLKPRFLEVMQQLIQVQTRTITNLLLPSKNQGSSLCRVTEAYLARNLGPLASHCSKTVKVPNKKQTKALKTLQLLINSQAINPRNHCLLSLLWSEKQMIYLSKFNLCKLRRKLQTRMHLNHHR